MGYVLGVDGGNTKTDYMLFTAEGRLVRHLRAGTCSHEAIGMEGARAEMDARIRALLQGAGITRAQVDAAAFGLAGIDQPLQKEALSAMVRELGFANSIAMNDSFLGIKAGSESGVGVCSINGTAMSAGGIDAQGHWVQVGGLGPISGDEAGGTYLAGRTLRAVYDAIFRFGERTGLERPILALFGCETPEDFHCRVSTEYMFSDAVQPLDTIRLLFEQSLAGDRVAHDIVRDCADTLARTAAGCAARLRFEGPAPLILIGSVWVKGRHGPMLAHFQERFAQYARMDFAMHILTVPPAAGSVLWALELAQGSVPDAALRGRVFQEMASI